jgi:hypothetical protein
LSRRHDHVPHVLHVLGAGEPGAHRLEVGEPTGEPLRRLSLPLRGLEQACVVDGNGGVGRDVEDQVLVLGGEDAGLGMAEEQPADHLPAAGDDRDGQVAAHRQVPGRHAVVGRVLPVPGVGGHVGEPDDPLAPERGLEDRRVPGHRELGERVGRRAGQAVEDVGLPRLAVDVVEEGAEVRLDEVGGGIGHQLDDLVQVEFGHQRRADARERLRHPGLEPEIAFGGVRLGLAHSR